MSAGSANDSSSFGNTLDDIVITGNRIEQIERPHHGTGIQILGAHGLPSTAHGNLVTGITLTDNEIIRTGFGI
jgi:hypothetical protein